MPITGERCKHGLYRNCHLCDYENEITRLKAENDELRKQLPMATDPTEPPSVSGSRTKEAS